MKSIPAYYIDNFSNLDRFCLVKHMYNIPTPSIMTLNCQICFYTIVNFYIDDDLIYKHGKARILRA